LVLAVAKSSKNGKKIEIEKAQRDSFSFKNISLENKEWGRKKERER
jgi:hypothetical protein